jgi:hypothetical protein
MQSCFGVKNQNEHPALKNLRTAKVLKISIIKQSVQEKD